MLCGAFAAGGVALWRVLGLHMHPEAEVSSVADAVDLIRQQRVRRGELVEAGGFLPGPWCGQAH